MHHGVADLDTGGPAVEQNSARFEFQHRQQLAGVVVVAFVGVHGRGQLAFDVLGDGAHLGGVGAADDQTGRAEDLGLQGLGLEEAGRVGGEQGCAAGCFAVASLSADDQVGLGAERVDTVNIVLCDAGGEHRRGRRLRDSVASRGEEAVKAGPSMAITRPGLVQNWPDPIVSDATNARPRSAPWAARAPSSRNTGLMELISA